MQQAQGFEPPGLAALWVRFYLSAYFASPDCQPSEAAGPSDQPSLGSDCDAGWNTRLRSAVRKIALVTVAGPIIGPVEVVRFCGSNSRGAAVLEFNFGSVS